MRFSIQYEKATVNNDIVSLIEKVKNKDYKDNDKVELGIVPEKTAKEIKKLFGVDLSGYKMVIEARQVYHIMKNHGIYSKSDQSMSNDTDIAKMEYAIRSYDEVRDGGKTQAYSYMKNGHNKTAPTILYEKEIGEKSYYVIQAVPETKKRTLYVVTAFIGKKGYKNEASQLINAKSPDVTAETGSVVTSNNIIPNSTENVKQKQLEIIEKVNPAPNTYNTWIRKVEDIKTLAETLEDSDWADGDEFNPDLTRDMIEEAIESGEITVYSSYPIEQGVFVSPSYMEAASYSGDGNVYEKTVKTDEVAWIDPTQGMYANIAESYSLSSKDTAPKKYGDYAVYGEDVMLEGEAKPTGKREFTAPTRESIAEGKKKVITGAPMRADVKKKFPMLDEDDTLPIRKDLKNDLLSRSAKSFGLTKPGDYVQVQRQVFDTLEKEGFFSDEGSRSRTVTNSDSSMQVEINKKGIKETFNYDNYGKFKNEDKALKLATVRMLPEIIEKGKLISDDVDNYHNAESSVKFAYIKTDIQVDGKTVSVKIDIKKSPQKNKFWVHSISAIKNVGGFPSDTSRVLKRGYIPTDNKDIIPETEQNVNSGEPVETTVIKTVEDRISAKIENSKEELSNNQRLLEESNADFDRRIAEAQAEYDAKKNKNTKAANNILRRIETLKRRKSNISADYSKRINDVETRMGKLHARMPTKAKEKANEIISQLKGVAEKSLEDENKTVVLAR